MTSHRGHRHCRCHPFQCVARVSCLVASRAGPVGYWGPPPSPIGGHIVKRCAILVKRPRHSRWLAVWKAFDSCVPLLVSAWSRAGTRKQFRRTETRARRREAHAICRLQPAECNHVAPDVVGRAAGLIQHSLDSLNTFEYDT